MKKKIMLVLGIVLVVCVVLGIIAIITFESLRSKTDDKANDFGFSYNITEGSFVRGERVGISVALTNQKNGSYVWTGSESNYRASVRLICKDGDTESFICLPELIPDTDDMTEHEMVAGETRTFDYYFTLPANAASGEYSLECRFGNSAETFDNVFTLE